MTVPSDRGSVVSLDVGATKIVGALLASDDSIVATHRAATPTGGEAVVAAVSDLVRRALERAERPQGIALAVAGQVDPRDGRVVGAGSSMPGWSGTDLVTSLSQRFGVPVTTENDGNAFAAGARNESECESLLGVMVGTGLGAGLVLDGSLRQGARFTAGEIGHLAAPAAGAWCSCGRPGHLEGLASGIGLRQHYAEATNQAITVREIAIRAAAGEARAGEVIRAGAVALGTELAGLAVALDLDRVVLGGGIVDNVPGFVEQCCAAFRSALPAQPATHASIEPVADAWRLVLIGAARLFRAAIATGDRRHETDWRSR